MRFFPGVKVRGSVAAVMAASVFAAGMAALAVLVMAAANVGVILKNVVYEGGCAGTQDAFSALCKGKTIDYCVERHPVPRLQGFLLPGSDREGAGSGEGGHHGRRLRELRRSEVS